MSVRKAIFRHQGNTMPDNASSGANKRNDPAFVESLQRWSSEIAAANVPVQRKGSAGLQSSAEFSGSFLQRSWHGTINHNSDSWDQQSYPVVFSGSYEKSLQSSTASDTKLWMSQKLISPEDGQPLAQEFFGHEFSLYSTLLMSIQLQIEMLQHDKLNIAMTMSSLTSRINDITLENNSILSGYIDALESSIMSNDMKVKALQQRTYQISDAAELYRTEFDGDILEEECAKELETSLKHPQLCQTQKSTRHRFHRGSKENNRSSRDNNEFTKLGTVPKSQSMSDIVQIDPPNDSSTIKSKERLFHNRSTHYPRGRVLRRIKRRFRTAEDGENGEEDEVGHDKVTVKKISSFRKFSYNIRHANSTSRNKAEPVESYSTEDQYSPLTKSFPEPSYEVENQDADEVYHSSAESMEWDSSNESENSENQDIDNDSSESKMRGYLQDPTSEAISSEINPNEEQSSLNESSCDHQIFMNNYSNESQVDQIETAALTKKEMSGIQADNISEDQADSSDKPWNEAATARENDLGHRRSSEESE